jgi:hypothetical protein
MKQLLREIISSLSKSEKRQLYRMLKDSLLTAKPENILGYNEELHEDFDYLNDMDSIASDDPNAPYDPDDYLPPQYRDIKCPQCGELTPEDDLVCIHCDYDRSYDSKVRR